MTPLRVWHLASLDAPTVSIVWAYGFAWAAHVRLPAWAPALLALGTWAVYIGDRLLDARAGMCTPPRHQLRERHHFHWRHRHVLAPLAAVAASVSLWLVLTRVPAQARVSDSAIAAATLAYFSGVHAHRRLSTPFARLLSALASRPVLIGILFTAGCLLPVWSQAGVQGTSGLAERRLVFPPVFFAALAWLNCHAISAWESNRRSSRVPVRSIAYCVSFSGVCVALLLLSREPRSAFLIAAGIASTLLLARLDRFRDHLTPLDLRTGADLVLLTPALLLMLPPFRL
jgi:hypothetical protein